MKYFTDRNIKYAGLVVPLMGCPIGEAIEDCPFKEFWPVENFEESLKPIEDLSDEKLDKLHEFHHKCLLRKIELARENPNDEKLSKINLDKFLYF